MPRIDAHGHVFAKASSEFPREISPLVPAEQEETVETLLTHMEANEIDQAMLVQIGGTAYEHHAYLKYCLATYPQKFLGIGLIPEHLRPTPEEHMDRLTDETGIVGFRLNSIGGPPDPFEPIDIRTFDTFRIWQHAAEKDYVLWLYVAARDAHQIGYMVEAFPQVRVVLNHLGICPGEGQFSRDQWGRPQITIPGYNPAFHTTHRLSKYENVALLMSGQYAFSREPFPYKDISGWQPGLLKNFGADRVMWATDFPWIYEHPGYDKLTTIIETTIPDILPHDLEAVMGKTASRFLRFPELTAQ